MECQKDWGLNDLDVVDYLVEQMNVKLATGEAFYQLQPPHFIALANFLLDHPNACQASQAIQRVGDYVAANSTQFAMEDKASIMRSLMSARYKTTAGEATKLTPAGIRQSIKASFGILGEHPKVDLGFSATDDRYSIHFKDIETTM